MTHERPNGIPSNYIEVSPGEWFHPSRARHAGNHSPRPIAEQAPCHEPVAAQEGETGHAGRLLVSVTSYRKRLCDPDNLCPKYFIDCLRYAQIIPDDRPQDIELRVSQEKSKQERTKITIERLSL